MENYGWRGWEEQKKQVTSAMYALFGSRNKDGLCRARQDVSKYVLKRQSWFHHTADKAYETISQVLLPALPAVKSLHTFLSKRRVEWKDTETTDKHVCT